MDRAKPHATKGFTKDKESMIIYKRAFKFLAINAGDTL